MVVETALALVLLTGAGLMMRTLQELTQVETGFRPDHLLTTRFTLAGEQWTPERRRPVLSPTCTSRLRALPGVTNAAFAFSLPIDGSNWNSIFIVADKPVPPRAQLPSAAFTPVSERLLRNDGHAARPRPVLRCHRDGDLAEGDDRERVARQAAVAGRRSGRQAAEAGLAGNAERVARSGRRGRRREVQRRHRRHADAGLSAARARAVAIGGDCRARRPAIRRRSCRRSKGSCSS